MGSSRLGGPTGSPAGRDREDTSTIPREVADPTGIVTAPVALGNRVWIRRLRGKTAMTLAMLPLYREMGHAWLLRVAAETTRGVRRKALLTASGSTLFGLLILAEELTVAALLVPIGLGPVLARLGAWVRRNHQLQRIAGSRLSVEGLLPARQTLLAMGLDAAAADRIATLAETGEVRLATFDDDNRILSDIGAIPHFEGVLVTPEEFRDRDRHRLELVITRGVVCVKKIYRDRESFESELLALSAITGVPGVPSLVAVRLRPRIVYQSFIVGRNLGSLMARHGATVSVQHQVSVSFSRSRRNREAPAVAREVALAALSASVNSGIVSQLAHLMDQIHERGVTIADIKYGNVLLADGQPYLCDFDHAAVYPRNTWRCVRSRETDRDKFNFFFGGGMLSEREFRAAAARLASQKHDLFADRIYYGYGYASPSGGSLERGSGQWRLIRRHLPDLAGKSVLDLSCRNGLMSLEMLRAGARRVTAFEEDSTLARYAHLNQQWFEFVDNRRYPEFQVLEGPPDDACDRDWTGYDLATNFEGFEGVEPERTARIVESLGRNIDCIVVRAAWPHDRHSSRQPPHTSLHALQGLLAANGYAAQTVIDFPDHPLLIGQRSRTRRSPS